MDEARLPDRPATPERITDRWLHEVSRYDIALYRDGRISLHTLAQSLETVAGQLRQGDEDDLGRLRELVLELEVIVARAYDLRERGSSASSEAAAGPVIEAYLGLSQRLAQNATDPDE